MVRAPGFYAGSGKGRIVLPVLLAHVNSLDPLQRKRLHIPQGNGALHATGMILPGPTDPTDALSEKRQKH